MMSRITHLLPLALMLFLAALTLGLQYAMQESPGRSEARRHDPDAVVENFTVLRLSDTGKPQYTFSAQKMQHFLDDDSSEALYPSIVHMAETGDSTTATASRGVITRNGEEAFLYGNVLIVREATPEHEEFRAHTEFMHMLSEKHIAQTDRQVTITHGRSILAGIGMVVNEDTQEFTLQSGVKGTYDAPKRK